MLSISSNLIIFARLFQTIEKAYLKALVSAKIVIIPNVQEWIIDIFMRRYTIIAFCARYIINL